MFHLTRRERLLVAAILLAFVTGAAVKHYRAQTSFLEKTPLQTAHADDRI